MASNSSSGLQNSTQSRYGGQFDIKFHTGLILISSLIITSNGLVIVLFVTMENLRKAGKLLLLSLAISDLTTGLVTIPLNISCEVTFSAPLCLASSTLNRFIGISTVYHILAVTFETYYAILRPMEHRVKVERSKVLGLVFGMWFAALLTALTPLYWTLGIIKNVRSIPSKEFLRKQAIYEIVVFITGFFLPLALMVFAHMRMFAKILDALKLLRSRSSPLSQPTFCMEEDSKEIRKPTAHSSERPALVWPYTETLMIFILYSCLGSCWKMPYACIVLLVVQIKYLTLFYLITAIKKFHPNYLAAVFAFSLMFIDKFCQFLLAFVRSSIKLMLFDAILFLFMYSVRHVRKHIMVPVEKRILLRWEVLANSL